MNELQKVEEALQLAVSHKYGDGDYTAYFEEALAALQAYKAKMNSAELVDEVARAICNHIAKNEPDNVKLAAWGRDMSPIAQAAINTITGKDDE